ncbi:lysophospholipid acyltransferase family protein [Thauera sinica]|uniref:Lysophospholipid acyltransferase family protein n=1 Tax=Thauera sinica TaxID=2665146 RepID=A0ABW1AX23_9RHOO|nr:lysophospholipid acyltransferase family protein [Thauera sp. K11]ATE58864.1 1-acyl-sn-glycerol-3-phosphate acyltransferase [Thauera sp. K11]
MTDAASAAIQTASLDAGSPKLLRGWRYFRLAVHVAEGALTIALVYPLSAEPVHRRLRQRWSHRLLRILGIRLQADGVPIEPGCMLVANHVSWVDIFVVNALAPSSFVSKAEVRNWPVIGWLAAKNGTIFLRRGSRGHARIINEETAAQLDAGRNVAIFPEGTTTDGSHVLDFHAALLQPAIAAGHAVQPVALSYHAPGGSRSRAPAYDGDISLGQCIANIIAERGIVARVQAAAPLGTGEGTDRRTLARQAREIIAGLTGQGYARRDETPTCSEKADEPAASQDPVRA